MPDVTDLGEIVITGQRITFPFGGGTSGGGGGGLPEDENTELDPNDPPPEEPCNDISGMTDEQKIKYLTQYLAQRVADLIRSNPVQNREWGSAIYRDANGDFGFTPLRPAQDHRANVDWTALPNNQYGQDDYTTIVALVHSHPRRNLHPDGVTGEVNFYDSADPTYLLRPWAGDWQSYSDIITNMISQGASPTATSVAMIILGYTEDASGAGSMALHGYDATHKPTSGDTPTATPEIMELQTPCNE